MRIKDNTANVLRETDRLITKGLEQSASIVKDKAIATVAVKTGATQRSIAFNVERRKAVIGAGTEYAPHLEIRKPFLRPALESSKAEIRRIFAK